jgi:hypothetical protein
LAIITFYHQPSPVEFSDDAGQNRMALSLSFDMEEQKNDEGSPKYFFHFSLSYSHRRARVTGTNPIHPTFHHPS